MYGAIIILSVIGALFIFNRTREALFAAIEKLFEILVSKRFITLMIATWFVYKDIDISTGWLALAGFYIGVDTMQNNGVFHGFADFLKNRKTEQKQ